MSTQILGRTPDGISLLTVGSQDQQQLCGSGAPILCSGDGAQLVALGPGAVKLVDISSAQEASSLPEDAVVLSAFSSGGGYLVTAQRPGKAADGSMSKNLKVWEVASGKCLFSIAHKQVAKDNWPVLHWAPHDSAFVYMVTNTVHVYSRNDNFATYRKVTIKGIGGLALSPVAAPGGGLPQLAAFLPEAKGTPAGAGLYGLEGSPEPTATVRKSFFRSQGAQLMWNSLGTACLVLSYADYDATNQSYYGEQKLHYLPADPAKAEDAVTVPLPKEGPVHDVQWSPAGDYFIAVAGFMPAKVTLFNALCKPVYDLGSGPYNLVRWNPFGRFFAICGFGNLPGDIMLFDKKTSGSCKQMGAVRSPAVSAEWSPCGRLLLTATTAPRLRVDNNVKVFTYYGEQKAHVPFATLLDAAWRPVAKDTYQDRPQSPERLSAAAKGEVATSAPTKPSYVPPHLRAAGVTSTAAVSSGAKFSLARDDDDRPGKIGAAGGRRTVLPPGAEFIAGGGNAKAASKNAKRRAKKKAGEASGEGDEGEEAGGAEGAEAATAALASSSLQDAAAAAPLSDEEARQKRIRALQKKQRQIQELKDKRAAGATMTPEQLEKLAGEAALMQELASLGA
ncbi:hypothetical protein CHLRE_08g375900v5 [Chlamydomonas reinhardtii]|uniref:Eukaryotic translation initiation factor 2A n=1 Tax=Chlamydomonas reinhardtii TaxID=3055 RepID=A0A2K3DHP9_CHLRE|nr:uncharacterized protein CHLRE_08g375900v5 [Chlamydomonas reinhardtii]PNW80053.1 hypothetical protein CHLRE_08g375900v5 [Chlamydomonas reinhardtii]